MLENMSIFNGMVQKMGFLQTRQRVLSQNISNADSPGYQALDVKAPNFQKTLSALTGQASVKQAGLAMSETESQHIAGMTHQQAMTIKPTRDAYDVTPTGNSVSLEEQMVQASQTAVDYQLITNLYNKNLDILRAAIRG